MRLRAAVPSLLALSLLTGIPAAHASGCGSSTDAAGDVPFKTMDMISVKVVRNKTRKVNNIQFVMTLGSTDAKSEPVTTGGVSYYILFNIKGTGYKIWRHVEPIWPGGNDVYGGMYAKNGIQPKVAITPTTITWTLPPAAYPTLNKATDACAMSGTVQVGNAENVDQTN